MKLLSKTDKEILIEHLSESLKYRYLMTPAKFKFIVPPSKRTEWLAAHWVGPMVDMISGCGASLTGSHECIVMVVCLGVGAGGSSQTGESEQRST